MSVYLSFDTEPGDFLSSNRGWSEFCEWIDSLPEGFPELNHIREYGWSQNIADLRNMAKNALKDFQPKDKDILGTGNIFVSLLQNDGDVVTVNDGMGPDIEGEMSIRHAPPGDGVNLAGKHFKPGQFIPDTSWNKATPEEKAQVDGKHEKPQQEKPIETIEELHERADKSAQETIAKTSGVFQKLGKAGKFIKQKTKAVYNALEKRYGRRQAIAIFAAGHVIGLATPAVVLPGSTILGMIPFAVMAEVYLQAKRGINKMSGTMSQEPEGLTLEEIMKLGKELAEMMMKEWAEYVETHGVKEE